MMQGFYQQMLVQQHQQQLAQQALKEHECCSRPQHASIRFSLKLPADRNIDFFSNINSKDTHENCLLNVAQKRMELIHSCCCHVNNDYIKRAKLKHWYLEEIVTNHPFDNSLKGTLSLLSFGRFNYASESNPQNMSKKICVKLHLNQLIIIRKITKTVTEGFTSGQRGLKHINDCL